MNRSLEAKLRKCQYDVSQLTREVMTLKSNLCKSVEESYMEEECSKREEPGSSRFKRERSPDESE